MTEPPAPRPPLLLTRPRATSEAFAARFRARFGADWPVILAPLIEIVPLAPQVPEAAAVIFTSQNAIAPLIAMSPAAGRRAYCVGARTAAAARAAGFEVITGAGDARALFETLRNAKQTGPLLHARGAEVAAPLADWLNAAGIETIEAILYRQESRAFEPVARALIRAEKVLLVPLFSPRSARLLADEIGARSSDAGPRLWVAAISEAVAEAARPLGAARLEIAPHPDAAGMEEALARLLGAADPG